ncbi:MAG: alpha/beta fold hydrolase [Vicinamibacteria bacterium]
MRWLRIALALLLGLALLLFALSFVAEPVPPTGAWLERAGLSARFETVDGVPIRYVRAGQGPPLVLVHGFGSSVYTWADLLPELARSHDVVALDLPGFGGSGLPEALSFEHLPEAVVGLMDRLGLERASLVGNSLGGATVAWIAATRQGRVERLVLVDAAGFQFTASERPLLLRLLALPGASLLQRLPLRRAIVRTALRQTFADPTRISDEDLDEYVAPALRAEVGEAALALARYPGPGPEVLRALLGRVRAPALVIWGREDRWIPLEHAERFHQALSGSRLVVLDGAGHLPQEERPAEVLRLLREFLG